MGESRSARAVFWSALLLATAVMWWARLRFWFPHDEGTLAQAAVRVLAGEVPHRDFHHPYTGLEAVLHAGVLVALGDSLVAIRTAFAAITTLWLVAMAYWFREHFGAVGGGIAVLVLGAWGPATYPAAMPSWYITFLVTGAIALVSTQGLALSAWRQCVAGFLLGVAVGFKVTALYAIAGMGLWLVSRSTGRSGEKAHPVALLATLCATAASWLVLSSGGTVRIWAHIGLPVCAAALWSAVKWVQHARSSGTTIRLGVLAPLLPFISGVILGVTLVVAWLVLAGGFEGFLTSLRGVTSARTGYASFEPPPVAALWQGFLVVAFLWAVASDRIKNGWVIAAVCVLCLFFTWESTYWHRRGWEVLRGAAPVGVTAMLMANLRRNPSSPMLSVGVLVFCWMALSQFPFAAPVYFVYLLPILLTACHGLIALSASARRGFGLLAVGVAVFGYVQVVPNSPAQMGWARSRPPVLAPIPGPRGGLLVAADEAAGYAQLLDMLSNRAPPGPIWAGPDSPEVAYLAHREDRNSTPFGFLAGHGGPSLSDLDSVAAVVVRREPAFSAPIPSTELSQLGRRFQGIIQLPSFSVYLRSQICSDC